MTHLRARDGWSVQPIAHAEVVGMCELWHYSRSAPNTAVYAHGLVHPDGWQHLGGALWIPPTRPAAESVCGEHPWTGVLVLSRLVIAPEVPTNGASFLLG